MKKLIAGVCVALCTTGAWANSWSMMNQNGGEIVITDRPCRVDGKEYAPLREAYSYWNGGYVSGCWHTQDDMIRVIWKRADGKADIRMYDPREFSPKTRTQKGNTY